MGRGLLLCIRVFMCVLVDTHDTRMQKRSPPLAPSSHSEHLTYDFPDGNETWLLLKRRGTNMGEAMKLERRAGGLLCTLPLSLP